MIDLFGVEVDDPWKLPLGTLKRTEIPKGYAAPPGTGPMGETCRTCKHYRSVKYHNKCYPKCALMARTWSHCYATDIRAKSPACRKWTVPDPVTWIRE